MASRGDPRRSEESADDSVGPEERALTAGACVLPPEISGLHVLVVDDDPLCLKIVGKMLRSCGYSVTTADGGKAALRLLNETPDRFALVLSDVQMPDMDGFRLMECMALELDVPVIMMSANGETSVVLRGITHGAVDYLLKPVRIEELRNIWQHVVRRRREGSPGPPPSTREEEERVAAANRAEKAGGRKEKSKRKEGDTPSDYAEEPEDASQSKKPRVVWSVELHQQFVNAVNSLGIDKAVPKRILDLMGVAGLTRENVASHLQKYRLYLKRIQTVSANGGGAAPAAPAAPSRAQQHAPPPQQPPPPPAAVAPLLPPVTYNVHLPGTAPGGGYPAHLLPLGGLNGDLGGFAPAGSGPLGLSLRTGGLSLASDIQAVSELDLGIHGLSMDALGGDELLAPSGVTGLGLGGGMVPSPSSDDMLSLFLKDALPEVTEPLP